MFKHCDLTALKSSVWPIVSFGEMHTLLSELLLSIKGILTL